MSYRISKKSRVRLTYTRFFDRFGSQQLEWEEYPGLPDVGTHMLFRFESRYTQHDLLVMWEYHPGWHGLYIMAGREITHERQVRHRTWLPFSDGEPQPTTVYVYRYHSTGWAGVVGAGYERSLGQYTYVNTTLTYTLQGWTGGPKIVVSMWYTL